MKNDVIMQNRSFLAMFCLTLLFVMLIGCSNSPSRSQIKSLIEDVVKKNSMTVTFQIAQSSKKGILYVNYSSMEDYNKQHLTNEYGDKFATAKEKWIELEKKGFLKIKIIEKKTPNWGGDVSNFLANTLKGSRVGPHSFPGKIWCPEMESCSYYDAFSLEFTPAAQPFIHLEENVQNGKENYNYEFIPSITSINATIELAKVDKVTVTGLTTPSNMSGKNVIQAEYIIEYKPTLIGEIYYPSNNTSKLKISRQSIFVKYDDGWRLETKL